MQVESRLEDLILKLFDIEGVKFGDFKLKSGIQSPAYFDLRVIVSYPKLMREVSQVLWETAKNAQKFVSICGVPYTALPIASVMSVDNDVPMLIRRREAKDYGTKKMIEGKYEKGDVCLVVEDVVTSGSSVYETVELLNEYGLQVKDAVVLLEREQGGTERLKRDGVNLHSVITMTQLVSVLKKNGKIDETMYSRVLKFVAGNRFDNPTIPSEMTYKERANLCKNSVSKQLLEIMEQKQSNLAVSADHTSASDILQLVDQVGSKVCIVKTHADIIDDFSDTFVHKLQELAKKHNFLIFEDRKFGDIGNTVLHQYKGGIHKIADWADIVNAHTVPGAGVVTGLKQVGGDKNKACLLVAEMSSSGSLAKGDYTRATVEIAKENSDFVIGFICQNKLMDDPVFIHMTPGVKLKSGTDSLGQQYITPKDAVFVNKSDLIIVGRGITAASDPVAEAELYRKAGYDAYLERLA
ncbi:uridine 5'-monophosphate synthase-like isoform X2 [Mercenaria mercenaria]|uniref:uridine 5'-monophosphate synthase-like isoform X2 n=1 Tax=Mercenaria mercenaria TaxID=6596 RepID=UPI00234F3061|nr:uridine 5'-monophosphate synthase-like isoform X2 [Mercenaria mercenaria]